MTVKYIKQAAQYFIANSFETCYNDVCLCRALAQVIRQRGGEEHEESLAVHGQPYENLPARTTGNNLREYTCFLNCNTRTMCSPTGSVLYTISNYLILLVKKYSRMTLVYVLKELPIYF